MKEFDTKRKQAEDFADAKTAKNRAKRQKKKGARTKNTNSDAPGADNVDASGTFKKRRLVNGDALVFKRPGDSDDEDAADTGPQPTAVSAAPDALPTPAVAILEEPRITIHDD